MTLIQPRRGTAAQWTTANPVLASAELGVETDTGRSKRGNGSSTWTALPYMLDETGAADAFVGRGPKPSGGDDTTALQSALNASAGSTLILHDGDYTVSAPLAPPAGCHLIGGPSTTIHQTVVNTPVIDVFNVDDVTVENLTLTNDAARTYDGTTFRGSQKFVYSAGVWSNGNRCTYRNLTVSNLTSGVYITSWNTTTSFDALRTANAVEHLDVSGVDFGLLAVGQDGVRVRGIRGTYSSTPGSGNPTHLIYWSDGVGFVSHSQDIDVSNCAAYDGGATGGHAFQFKGIKGGSVRGLKARNCSGVLTIFSCEDVNFSGITSRADLGDSQNSGVIYMGDDNSQRVRIRDVSLQMAAEKLLARLGGVDCSLTGLTASVSHATTADSVEVSVNGTRFTLEDVRVTNSVSTGGWRIVSISSGSAACIKDIKGIYCRAGVYVDPSVTGAFIDIDPSRIGAASGYSGYRVIDNNASGTAIQRGARRIAYSGAGGTFTVQASDGDYHEITTTTTNSLAVANPYSFSRAVGLQITIAIVNASAGAMGTTTWGTDFAFQGGAAPATPAAGARIAVRFVWDGANWRELFRSA